MIDYTFRSIFSDKIAHCSTNEDGLGLTIDGVPVLSKREYSTVALKWPKSKIRRYLKKINYFGELS